MSHNAPQARRAGLTRPLGSLALLVLIAVGPAPAPAAPPPPVTATIVTGGKKVRVEQFVPEREGKFPAALFLYGIDGMHEGNRDVFRKGARAIASQGFVVLIVHYLDRTGTRRDEAPALTTTFLEHLRDPAADGKGQRDLGQKFAAWESAVKEAVAYARAHPRVDAGRVALVGYSLGGFLAASVAADPAQRVGAVVTLFGGLPPRRRAGLKSFPPALVLSGDKDKVVPVKESRDLCELLRARKVPCEAQFYKGMGHGFERGGKIDTVTALLAQYRLCTFLTKHLGKKAPQAAREQR